MIWCACETTGKGKDESILLPSHTLNISNAVQYYPLVRCLANIMAAKGFSVSKLLVKKSPVHTPFLSVPNGPEDRGNLPSTTDIVSPRCKSSHKPRRAVSSAKAKWLDERINRQRGVEKDGVRHSKNRHLIKLASKTCLNHLMCE